MLRIIGFRVNTQASTQKYSRCKVCAFTGHRPQSLPFGFNEADERCINLKKALREQIINLVENEGITHFISGMAIGVDMPCNEERIRYNKLRKKENT